MTFESVIDCRMEQTVEPQPEVDQSQPKEERLVSFEEYVQSVHWFQKFFRFRYFDFVRTPSGLVSNNFKQLLWAWVLMFNYMLCNLIDIGRWIVFGVPHNQNFAVFTITVICFIRGLLVTVKQNEIQRIFNALDHIFPTTYKLQQVFKAPEHFAKYSKRFHLLHIYTEGSQGVFFTVPLVLFLLNQKRDEPIHFDHQVLCGWMPFGLKDSYTAYPYVYLYEVIGTLSAISFIITWDTCFNIMYLNLCMHLDMIADQTLKIDARRSHNPEDAKKLYRFIYELISYQQQINTIGRDFNDLFKLSILVNDFICGVSICLQLYFITNTSDVMLIIKYLAPGIVLVYFSYDVSMCGTQFEASSAGIHAAIYNHNWYEGSNKYKKLILRWLIFSQNTLKLKGFQMLEVNMVHFKDVMMMAYQLFTFLQSRKS